MTLPTELLRRLSTSIVGWCRSLIGTGRSTSVWRPFWHIIGKRVRCKLLVWELGQSSYRWQPSGRKNVSAKATGPGYVTVTQRSWQGEHSVGSYWRRYALTWTAITTIHRQNEERTMTEVEIFLCCSDCQVVPTPVDVQCIASSQKLPFTFIRHRHRVEMRH